MLKCKQYFHFMQKKNFKTQNRSQNCLPIKLMPLENIEHSIEQDKDNKNDPYKTILLELKYYIIVYVSLDKVILYNVIFKNFNLYLVYHEDKYS